ncbi:oligosaccharide flippase family protein [Phenylobacterium sp.]|uniref:oligosaccharide flippase family protein n=1 Tax=Phenylobacterium sp. TaxID=1871053 RepID=UPI003BA9B52C
MRRGAKIFLIASLVAQAAALVRYVILARMLGPAELGLAATLILTAQFFESLSDTGANRYVVQDARGHTPEVMGLVHMILAGRGILLAAALALTAGLVADLYKAPILAPGLIALGLTQVILGFQNLEVRRVQRDGDFRPEAVMTIAGEVTSAIAIAAAAWIVRDHTAVIYGLTARALIMLIVSHVMAERRYAWAFGKADAVAFSRFASPLFLNGLLLFFGSQGDRILVGASLGAEGLGYYSAIILLIYYPAAALSRFVASLHMPNVARTRDNPEKFAREREQLGGRAVLLSTAMLLGFCLAGPLFAPLLYGHAFAQPLPMFAALALLQAVRLARCWPTTLALGTGDSFSVLAANVVRVVALPAAIFAYKAWPSVYAIVGAFILGELLSLATALIYQWRRRVVRARREFVRSFLFTLVGSVAVALSATLQERMWAWSAGVAVVLLGTLALHAWTERPTILHAWGLVRSRIFRRA